MSTPIRRINAPCLPFDESLSPAIRHIHCHHASTNTQPPQGGRAFDTQINDHPFNHYHTQKFEKENCYVFLVSEGRTWLVHRIETAPGIKLVMPIRTS